MERSRGSAGMLLLVALAVGALVFLYFQSGGLGSTKSFNLRSLLGNLSLSTTDAGNGWRLYKDSTYHFSIKFPADTSVQLSTKTGEAGLEKELGSYNFTGKGAFLQIAVINGGLPSGLDNGRYVPFTDPATACPANISVCTVISKATDAHGAGLELRFSAVLPDETDMYSSKLRQIANTVSYQ